jgi:DNA polymerase family A
MLRIFGDFESFYDRTYSLRKLSPAEYILDSRWETLACAVAVEHEPPLLLPQDDVQRFLRGIKQPYAFISHNALFDACILAYRYDIHPPALMCTLSLARATIYHQIANGRLALKNVAKHLGIGVKSEFIQQMVGVHWRDLIADPGKMMLFTAYAINDTELCREIFFQLRPYLPPMEALVMDRLIRMATQPVLQVNVNELEAYRETLRRKKAELLSRVTLTDPGALASSIKFAGLLAALGVDPPMKISPSDPEGKKQTYAFAKSDQAFTDLLEHEDPMVQALVAARLGVKSTIEETRSTRFIAIGDATYMHGGRPLMPVPLKYSGAHTHRYSGDWLLNMQNLSARKNKEIRRCLYAPAGYTLVAVDAAQIEARIVAWLADQTDLLEMYINGEDTYKAFAADIFGLELTQVGKVHRFVGKTCILGLGFGMSARKLFFSIRTLSREQGVDLGFELTLAHCEAWVFKYRQRFRYIQQLWNDLNDLLARMAAGQADGYQVGPCVVDGTTVIMPSGLRLFYDNLRYEVNPQGKGNWVYDQAQFTKRIYGAKLLENIDQGLDRQHVVEAGLRTEMRARALGIPDPRVLLNIHDENIHCVPDEHAYTLAAIALQEMARNVQWSTGLPLNAEVKLGRNLAEMEEWKGYSDCN